MRLVGLKLWADYDSELLIGSDGHTYDHGNNELAALLVKIEQTVEVSGERIITTITNNVQFPRGDSKKIVILVVFAECFVSELQDIMSESGDELSDGQAAAWALCCLPSKVSEVLEGVQYGNSNPLFPDSFPLTMTGQTSDSSPVPTYDQAFIDLFKGTTIHSSMDASNFVTSETNKLRAFCSEHEHEPSRIVAYIGELRERVSIRRSSIMQESPHVASVFSRFEEHEVSEAEAFYGSFKMDD